MVNPHNSPWLKSSTIKSPPINDIGLRHRWKDIAKYLKITHQYYERKGILTIIYDLDKSFYISKHTLKMRLRSHLDWAYYSPKSLAQAMDSNQVEQYYEFQLKHPNSDPNIWLDKDKEMELKTYYAQREGRASEI